MEILVSLECLVPTDLQVYLESKEAWEPLDLMDCQAYPVQLVLKEKGDLMEDQALRVTQVCQV